MPDMERLFRSLELHVAKTPEEKAYITGFHKGLDTARKQVVLIAVSCVLGTIGILFIFRSFI